MVSEVLDGLIFGVFFEEVSDLFSVSESEDAFDTDLGVLDFPVFFDFGVFVDFDDLASSSEPDGWDLDSDSVALCSDEITGSDEVDDFEDFEDLALEDFDDVGVDFLFDLGGPAAEAELEVFSSEGVCFSSEASDLSGIAGSASSEDRGTKVGAFLGDRLDCGDG